MLYHWRYEEADMQCDIFVSAPSLEEARYSAGVWITGMTCNPVLQHALAVQIDLAPLFVKKEGEPALIWQYNK